MCGLLVHPSPLFLATLPLNPSQDFFSPSSRTPTSIQSFLWRLFVWIVKKAGFISFSFRMPYIVDAYNTIVCSTGNLSFMCCRQSLAEKNYFLNLELDDITILHTCVHRATPRT